MKNSRIPKFASLGLMLAIGTCTAQQNANLYAAAVISCAGAQIAAQAAVSITADLNRGPGSQADAITAQKVTTDSCKTLSALGTVVAATQAAGATPVQTATANPPQIVTAPAAK